MQVEDIMKSGKAKKSTVTINRAESVNNAATLMKQNKTSELTVVDDDDKPVGVVTKSSLIEAADDISEDFFLD
jgi:predicted transcriptional regulator